MSDAGSPAILQRYHLLRKIATGGMAEVYLAEQTGAGGFKKRVAIKRILPQFAEDPKFVEMFLDEARLAALFHHPNLIQIYELGEIDGLLSMVMEYVRGLSLSEVIKRSHASGSPKLPPGIAARILLQAAEGLDYAHEFADPDSGEPLNLVHRDVSPQNILLSREGIAKVMDFGIAKAAGNLHHTSTGTLKGKLAYMPPEQLNGKPLDRRADVWALGVVLYELLAGRRPFVGDSEASVFRAILMEPLPPLDELAEEVPGALRQIVNGALAREVTDRTPSAAELSKQLEGWLAGSGDRTSIADVADWLRPLLPATTPGASAESPQLTPSNIARPVPNTKITSPTKRSSLAASRAAAAVEPLGAGPMPDLDIVEVDSTAVSPRPKPARGPWLWLGGGALAAFALVAAAVLGHELGGERDPVSPPSVASRVDPPGAVAVPAPQPPAAPVKPAPIVVATAPAPAPAPPPPPMPAPRIAPKRTLKRASHHLAHRGGDSGERTIGIGSHQGGGTGSLVVNTEPWSKVYVDGREIGDTPLPNVTLAAGRHLLVCKNPDNGLVHRETILIQPGEPTRRFIQLGGGE
ncbi:MAG: protein kinase domain-containing protein [Deltaproteobacteria bacterium]